MKKGTTERSTMPIEIAKGKESEKGEMRIAGMSQQNKKKDGKKEWTRQFEQRGSLTEHDARPMPGRSVPVPWYSQVEKMGHMQS